MSFDMDNGYKRRSSRSPSINGINSKKSKVEELEMETRILFPDKYAGPVIGKGGENINQIRDKFGLNINLADCGAPERILNLTGGTIKQHIQCIEAILEIMKDNRRGDYKLESEVRILVHESQAGAVIGKGGNKIREIRDRTRAHLKVFPTVCPKSTERTVLIAGQIPEIVETLYEIYEILSEVVPRGPKYFYSPVDYVYYAVSDYGGFIDERARKAALRDVMPVNSSRSLTGAGGGRYSQITQQNYGGSSHRSPPTRDNYDLYRTDYGHIPAPAIPSPFSPYDGPSDYYYDRRIPAPSTSVRPLLPIPASSQPSYSERETIVTQVTIPKELAGAIIGRSGERINRIRDDSRCKIKLEEIAPGDKDRIITIEGTSDAIRYAQMLLQDAVRKHGGKRARNLR